MAFVRAIAAEKPWRSVNARRREKLLGRQLQPSSAVKVLPLTAVVPPSV